MDDRIYTDAAQLTARIQQRIEAERRAAPMNVKVRRWLARQILRNTTP